MNLVRWINFLLMTHIRFYIDDPGGGDGGGDGGGEPEITYPEGIDESLKGDKTLINYFDKEKKEWNVPGIMKALVHNKRMVGADKIEKPKESWTAEDWTNWARTAGMPDNVDSYKLGIEDNPEAKLDAEFLTKFKQKAYESGVLPKQAENLVQWYNEMVGEQQKQSRAQYEEKLNEGKRTLIKELGDAYDSKIARAEFALDTLVTSEQKESLMEKGLLDDPDVTRLLIKVSETFDEDKFPEGGNTKGGMTVEEVQSKISELYQQLPKVPRNQRSVIRDQIMKLSAIKARNKSGQRSGKSAIL